MNILKAKTLPCSFFFCKIKREMTNTPIKNTKRGRIVRPIKPRESSRGGLFSGARKMWDISSFGSNRDNGSTA
jgi:hypothetical protein